jgi:hypothetical protein
MELPPKPTMMEEDEEDNDPPLHQPTPQEELLDKSKDGEKEKSILKGYKKKVDEQSRFIAT